MVSCKRGREGKEGGREGGVGEGKDECEEGEKEDLAWEFGKEECTKTDWL